MGLTWTWHGLDMDLIWTWHGLDMDLTWIWHEEYMEKRWGWHGVDMGWICRACQPHVSLHVKSMSTPCILKVLKHGVDMGLTWGWHAGTFFRGSDFSLEIVLHSILMIPCQVHVKSMSSCMSTPCPLLSYFILIPCQPHVKSMFSACPPACLSFFLYVNPMSSACQVHVNCMSTPCQPHVFKGDFLWFQSGFDVF